MPKLETSDKIAERLRTRPSRTTRTPSATTLVRTYYDEICAARSAPNGLCKTWQEVAEDLSIHNPLRPGTVARAFNRIKAARDISGTPKRPETGRAVTSGDRLKTSDLFSTPASVSSHLPQKERRNPFGHQVDTFGLTDDETGEA